jgi:hypothetical protein
MKTTSKDSRLAKSLRWTARIWGLLAALTVLLVVLVSDKGSLSQPAPWIEWALLALYGVAALALLLAWRWEAVGGWLAVLCMLVEIFGFRLVKGTWYPTLAGLIVPLAIFALPGILFVLVSALSRRQRLAIHP